MDRFLVRRAAPAEGPGAPPAKQARAAPSGGAPPEGPPGGVAAREGAAGAAAGDPRRILSWNVNGLFQRQRAVCSAALGAPLGLGLGPGDRGLQRLQLDWSTIHAFLLEERPDVVCLQEGCKKGDGQRRRRGEAKQETRQEREEWALVEKTLLGALRQEYAVHWSLADWKYSGTAMLIRRGIQPSRVLFTLPALAREGVHRDPADPHCHPEGRVILASFETFDLLATYAPNNGNDAAAFARRAAWDAAMLEELSARSRPLVWIGDLNCAAAEADVSHPAWFLQQCHQGEPPDMRGQPGFTEGERRRFGEIMAGARLVDAHRRLHPASEPPAAEGPHYTWRGHPPVHQPELVGRVEGTAITRSLAAEACHRQRLARPTPG
ncbi:unnamed protein product, partial [Prorocentrum cordatum]